MMNTFPVRSWSCWLAVLSLMALVGCSRSLDVKTTEKTLKEELAKQGVGSLKQVSCPEGLKAGQKFNCIGIFESGIGFNIPVEQKGETDKLVWEVPTIKGMLNMNQVMKTIQDELKLGAGAIDCGTNSTYRMATLGSTFECVIKSSLTAAADPKAGKEDKEGKDSKDPKAETPEAQAGKLPPVQPKTKLPPEPDKIEIAIAGSGDVTWQRMVAAAPGKAGQLSGADAKGDAKTDGKAAAQSGQTAGEPGATAKPKTPDGQPESAAAGKAKEDAKSKSGNGKPAADDEEVPYDS